MESGRVHGQNWSLIFQETSRGNRSFYMFLARNLRTSYDFEGVPVIFPFNQVWEPG